MMEVLIFATALLGVAIAFQVIVTRFGPQAERALVTIKEKRQRHGKQ